MSPDTAVLVDGIAQLHRISEQHGVEHDQSGRLAQPVVDALHENGMFGLWVPAELGGRELDPVASVQVIAELAYADPSTAWVVMAACLATGAAGAYLSDSAVGTLFGNPRLPVIAGQGTRPGHAAPVDGGYLLTGSWSFGSGLKHADYVHTLGAVEGTGENRIFIVPVEKATLDEASWDVLGLRGTGSVDYTIDGVFVPHEYSYPNTITTAARGGPLYRLGIFQFALIGHSGWALGLARRMLDELAALTRSRLGRAGREAGAGAFQSEFALAEAEYHSARAFVLQAWRDLSEALYADGPTPTREQTLIRLALYNATWAAARISEFVYRAAGTTALRSGTIQRFYRDMHAGTQHVTSGPGVIGECGRELAGLTGDARWAALTLVEPGVSR